MFDKFGKTLTIFIILTIILLLSSTCIGFYLYHLEERLHKSVETQLDASRASEQKLQAQLKDIQAQLALSQDKNKEADQKINNLLDEEDLNEGLRAALKKENVALKEQIESLEGAKQKLRSDLDDSAAKLSQYQALLKDSEDKGKELESRLAGLAETNKGNEAKITELMAELKPYQTSSPTVPVTSAPPSTPPPVSATNEKVELDKIVVNPQDGTQGHVVSVDTDAEFVIFNLGLKEGIKPDDLLSVYEDNKYLGDIKATRVQDELSAADIIPPLSVNAIHKNDIVILKP